jgi:hypothetical protein
MADDITTYELGGFKKYRRWEIRKSLEQVDAQQLSKTEALLERNAYAVHQGFRERTRGGVALPPAESAAALRKMVQDGCLRWYGWYVGARLASEATIAEANRHASIGHIDTHTDRLPTCIDDGLVYDVCRRCREREAVDQIYFGLWSSKSLLDRFKERMLFKRGDLPACVQLRWPAGRGLRLLRALAYRRAVGFSPDQFGNGGGGACSEGRPS